MLRQKNGCRICVTEESESKLTDEAICEVNGRYFLMIMMEQRENNQITETPDVQTKTCQSSPRQEQENESQSKFVVCHLQSQVNVSC